MEGPVPRAMPVRWAVDPAANAALWRDLSAMPLRLTNRPGQWVADLGGGNGSFAAPVATGGARVVTIDVDPSALRQAPPIVRALRGSLLQMPLRDASMDGVGGRAILHHVPDDLAAAVREARRIVKPGGLALFQEPTSGNPIANAARRWFPTERHDPHERPLPLAAYVEAVRREFEVLEVAPYFLLSYLMPHFVARLPPTRRDAARTLTRVLFAWDRQLLSALPGLQSRAAYVSILARRPP